MVRKMFHIALCVCFVILAYLLSVNNGRVVVDFTNYQLITTTNFIICFIILVCLFFYSIFKIRRFIFRPENLQKKFNNYVEYITKGLIYSKLQRYEEADKNLNKGKKIYNNNLTKYLEYLILNKQGKYDMANRVFNEISIKDFYNELMKLKLDYVNAKENNNTEAVEKTARHILEIEPKNSSVIKKLLSIYISRSDWQKANDVLNLGLKVKVFNQKSGEFFLVNKKIGEEYYDKNCFDKAREFLENAYKNNKTENDISFALAKTYLVLGERSKALKVIESVWKYAPNKELLDLYFLINNNQSNKVKIVSRLIKINSKTFYSYYAVALASYQDRQYEKARKNLKIAEKINPDKIIYELLLKVETETGANTTAINLLKNKIN
ncbi:MAG: hypothetical protein LBC92_01560 [Rickettsiales bacterium]|jgi:uncharacterized protein HemY|nr:hypothetical protein [Rickettsiales bacterium]